MFPIKQRLLTRFEGLKTTLEQHGSNYPGACFVAKTHACMKELIITIIKEKSLARNKLKART